MCKKRRQTEALNIKINQLNSNKIFIKVRKKYTKIFHRKTIREHEVIRANIFKENRYAV